MRDPSSSGFLVFNDNGNENGQVHNGSIVTNAIKVSYNRRTTRVSCRLRGGDSMHPSASRQGQEILILAV